MAILVVERLLPKFVQIVSCHKSKIGVPELGQFYLTPFVTELMDESLKNYFGSYSFTDCFLRELALETLCSLKD